MIVYPTKAIEKQAARVQREITKRFDIAFAGREWYPRTAKFLPTRYEAEVHRIVAAVTQEEVERLNSMSKESRIEFAAILMGVEQSTLADTTWRTTENPWEINIDVRTVLGSPNRVETL